MRPAETAARNWRGCWANVRLRRSGRSAVLGTFFFDLPTDEERETIWGIYLKKHGVSGGQPNDKGWTGLIV
jgi:hypothetical protein